MNWYVLYTKPRSEQKTAKELENLGIEAYCPVITEVRKWSDRTKKVTTPLFKSYVFVRLKENERNKVFDVPTVVSYLNWLKKPAIVKEKEIETIKEWLNDSRCNDLQVHSIAPGNQVKIHNGALKGRSGTVTEVGKREVKLVLESLGFVITTKIRDVL